MTAKKRIRLQVASPCNAKWSSMKGDDAIRFCGSCKKSVYQLSNMSTDQVETLLAESGDRACVRFYQRKDGTLLTKDCFVGLRRKRRKQAVVGAGMGVLSAIGLGIGGGSPAAPHAVAGEVQQVEQIQIQEAIETTPVPPVIETASPAIEEPTLLDDDPYEHVMGRMSIVDMDDFDDDPLPE